MKEILGASNSDTIQFFIVHTLINITHTAKPRTISRKNFDTLINGISMRCQPLGSDLPIKKRQILSNYKFGTGFNTKTKNVWSWSFFVEEGNSLKVGKLMQEINGMPVLDMLGSVDTQDGILKNTYFEESPVK